MVEYILLQNSKANITVLSNAIRRVCHKPTLIAGYGDEALTSEQLKFTARIIADMYKPKQSLM